MEIFDFADFFNLYRKFPFRYFIQIGNVDFIISQFFGLCDTVLNLRNRSYFSTKTYFSSKTILLGNSNIFIGDRIEATTAKSSAGSSVLIPPVIFRNTSLDPSWKPARFSNTARSIFSLLHQNQCNFSVEYHKQRYLPKPEFPVALGGFLPGLRLPSYRIALQIFGNQNFRRIFNFFQP